MSGITFTEFDAYFTGICLECFFYGVYSGIFALYIQYHLFLFDLSRMLHLEFIQVVISGCCVFISQSVLIYRCWIIWGCNIRVVILPSMLVFTFLGACLAINGSWFEFQGAETVTQWGYTLGLTTLAISLSVNALVTGLIVLKIFKVYREVYLTSENRYSRKLRSIIFVLIESGMTLFTIQVIQIVFSILVAEPAVLNGFVIIVGINEVVNGITPTIILVRVAMGSSFHDEQSMIETASLHFASVNANENMETGSISIEHHHDSGGELGNIDDQLNNDSDI